MINSTCVVEIFKTDVESREQAEALVRLVEEQFPQTKANVDLHDCDRVLRVEGAAFENGAVTQLVLSAGFFCKLLD